MKIYPVNIVKPENNSVKKQIKDALSVYGFLGTPVLGGITANVVIEKLNNSEFAKKILSGKN